MTRLSLTQLYRRHAGKAGIPDADAVLRAAQTGTSDPPLTAHLARFGRDLETASAELAAGVDAAFANAGAAHRNGASRRAAHARPRRRAIAAIAAALVAAFGAWTLRHQGVPTPAPRAMTADAPDRIFASFDERRLANQPARAAQDEIFRGKFVEDHIFSAKYGG